MVVTPPITTGAAVYSAGGGKVSEGTPGTRTVPVTGRNNFVGEYAAQLRCVGPTQFFYFCNEHLVQADTILLNRRSAHSECGYTRAVSHEWSKLRPLLGGGVHCSRRTTDSDREKPGRTVGPPAGDIAEGEG